VTVPENVMRACRAEAPAEGVGEIMSTMAVGFFSRNRCSTRWPGLPMPYPVDPSLAEPARRISVSLVRLPADDLGATIAALRGWLPGVAAAARRSTVR
jgi:hypothetical protein